MLILKNSLNNDFDALRLTPNAPYNLIFRKKGFPKLRNNIIIAG